MQNQSSPKSAVHSLIPITQIPLCANNAGLDLRHTGTSMTATTALVFLSPIIQSQAIRAKKRTIMQATLAGNETELNPMRELTPKQARRMTMIPNGTYIQARRFRCHDNCATSLRASRPSARAASIAFLVAMCFLGHYSGICGFMSLLKIRSRHELIGGRERPPG